MRIVIEGPQLSAKETALSVREPSKSMVSLSRKGSVSDYNVHS